MQVYLCRLGPPLWRWGCAKDKGVISGYSECFKMGNQIEKTAFVTIFADVGIDVRISQYDLSSRLLKYPRAAVP